MLCCPLQNCTMTPYFSQPFPKPGMHVRVYTTLYVTDPARCHLVAAFHEHIFLTWRIRFILSHTGELIIPRDVSCTYCSLEDLPLFVVLSPSWYQRDEQNMPKVPGGFIGMGGKEGGKRNRFSRNLRGTPPPPLLVGRTADIIISFCVSAFLRPFVRSEKDRW